MPAGEEPPEQKEKADKMERKAEKVLQPQTQQSIDDV